MESLSRGRHFQVLHRSRACGFPVPGQEVRKLMAFGLAGDDALEDISEPGLRVYIVELLPAA